MRDLQAQIKAKAEQNNQQESEMKGFVNQLLEMYCKNMVNQSFGNAFNPSFLGLAGLHAPNSDPQDKT